MTNLTLLAALFKGTPQQIIYLSMSSSCPVSSILVCHTNTLQHCLKTAQPDLSLWFTHFYFCPFWSVPVKILASLLMWTPAPPPVFLSFTLAAVILSQATWALISIHCTLFFTSFACCPLLWMVDPIKSTHCMYKITNIHT